jgi:hypothetical protein
LPGHAAVGVLACAMVAAAARGQFFYPYIGGPGANPYLGSGWYYGPYPYDGPGSFYDTAPHPPVGSYVPHQQPALPPYTVPPGGLIPQPQPYSYQPPLYVAPPYIGPYRYYAPHAPVPYYYRYRYSYTDPRCAPQPRHSYRAAPRQNVAPVGSEPLLDEDRGPPEIAAGGGNPAAGRGRDAP